VFVPVVIHKDPESDYGVTVPDLPGCFSAGDNLADALAQAREAIELHLEDMLADGDVVPAMSELGCLQEDADQDGGVWHLVEIDPTKISGRARRVNVTIPENLLTVIDGYVATANISRSGFLAEAAMQFISREQVQGNAIHPDVINRENKRARRRRA
jgi:predicted RNase H-like HicB family nuclease